MAGFLLLLQACMSAPQTKQLLQSPQMLDLVNPLVHEILDVPFYPQQDFYCGPTTLTEALNYYNKNVQPEQIAPELFIPGRKGSLQIEMLASARRQDMLAYAHEGTLEQLLSLVSENIPVIVLQNLGTSWYP